MAIGDTKSAWTSTAAAGTLVVQPAAGEEWIVTTIEMEYQKGCELQRTSDGSTFTKEDVFTGGSVHNLTYTLTNTNYLRLKNTDAGTAFIGYGGRQTK